MFKSASLTPHGGLPIEADFPGTAGKTASFLFQMVDQIKTFFFFFRLILSSFHYLQEENVFLPTTNNQQHSNKNNTRGGRRRGGGVLTPLQKAQMLMNTLPTILLTTCTRPPGVPEQKHISDFHIMTSFSHTDD